MAINQLVLSERWLIIDYDISGRNDVLAATIIVEIYLDFYNDGCLLALIYNT